MYAGNLVEYGSAAQIFAEPKHPYTMGLLASLPRLDETEQTRLVPIEASRRTSCASPGLLVRAALQVSHADLQRAVPTYDFGSGHIARCFLYDQRPNPNARST